MINQDFNSILDLIKAFPNEQTCIDHLETLRWNGNVISPFDAISKVYKCKGNKYRCRNSGKYFNVKTDTLFDNTKIELQKWFLAIWMVTSHKKGISSLQLHRDLNITQKTAWFMLQRIRNCFGIENDNDSMLDNEVEMDETFIGGKETNKHKNRQSYNTFTGNKAVVFGMIEREGNLKAVKVENRDRETLYPIIVSKVKTSAKIYTDEHQGYGSLKHVYDHKYIKHVKKQYVLGKVHTNSIEGFWSLLKRGIFGIYHSTSKKHLQKYVDEFVFRYNTREITEAMRFNLLLSNIENRLTYNELIG